MNQRTRLKRSTVIALRLARTAPYYHRADRSTQRWRLVATLKIVGLSAEALRKTVEDTSNTYQRLSEAMQNVAYKACREESAPQPEPAA